MIKFKNIITAFGPCGREAGVREEIVRAVDGFEHYSDNIGNLIVHKHGVGKKLMLSANIDSLGIAVTYIEENGNIRFKLFGKFCFNKLANLRVRFKSNIIGIIGCEPCSGDISEDKCYIDIGFNSREAVIRHINIGDFASLDLNFFEIGECLAGVDLENRLASVAILNVLDSIKSHDIGYDLYVAFCSQRQVGFRGIKVATQGICPELCIDIDTQCVGAYDIKSMCGPVIRLFDADVIYNDEVTQVIENAANSLDISVQKRVLDKAKSAGGVIQKTNDGSLIGGLSIPVKNMDYAMQISCYKDIMDTIEILKHILVL